VPAIREALRAATSPEVRLRLQNLLEAVKDIPIEYSPHDVAISRAARVLETIGTKEAKAALKGLNLPPVADGGPPETAASE
jgi:hypothetical protein